MYGSSPPATGHWVLTVTATLRDEKPRPESRDRGSGLSLWGRRQDTLRARDEITESKEKNPAAGRNAGKESGVYA
jgi:hypothetical protein